MPQLDGTGPQGLGPGRGRGAGNCQGAEPRRGRCLRNRFGAAGQSKPMDLGPENTAGAQFLPAGQIIRAAMRRLRLRLRGNR